MAPPKSTASVKSSDTQWAVWLYAVPIALSIVLLAVMYHHVLWKLIQDWWHDPNYSHGFLIPLITAFLIWERRAVIRQFKPQPSILGPLVLAGAGILYVIGQVAGELFTQRLSFVITLIGLILSWGGMPLWKIIWAPICYLIFMIPLPYILYDSIAFPLKLAATKASTQILQVLGITMYSEGNLIYLPNTTLEVADACSGIRSLISVLALSVIIAKYTQQTTARRMLLILLSIPVVLFCNMLRIIITGFLASKDSELSTGFFHAFSGEIIFLAGVAMLFGIALMIGRNGKFFRFGSRIRLLSTKNNDIRKQTLWPVWLSPAVLAVVLALNMLATQVQATPLLRPLSDLPVQIDGFQMVVDEPISMNVINILGVDHYIMRFYKGPSSYPLWLYIGYFEDQKEGSMIHSPKHCYPGGGWQPLSSRIIEIEIPDSKKTIRVNEYLLAKGENRQLVHYWYQSRSRVIANEYEDRLYMIIDSLFKRRSDGALIRISGPADNLERARQLQLEFIESLYPTLKQFLPS